MRGKVRPTDQGTTANEKTVWDSQLPRGGGRATRSSTRVSQAEGAGGGVWMQAKAFTVAPWEGTGNAGEAGLQLVSLDNFSGLWGVWLHPGLVPGLGVIRAGGVWPRV